LTPKANQYQHHSTYLDDIPDEWLGQTFIDEAEHLKEVNPTAYRHEYLGEITGTGGLIFSNIELRKITDDEIKEFDHIHYGLDWGYALDPLHWVKLHYDAKKEIIYILDEFRAHKMSNHELYEVLTKNKGITPEDVIIADSAEPKSIADMREYGLSVRGSMKGADSVRYSMRWLENRAKIVVDNQRAPYTTEELLNYEYEQTKDGDFVSEYPDFENHGIDSIRYALNLVWKRRGQ
jgi:phage terminase large subunit